MKCPCCNGNDWQPSKTDLGMPHWKAEGMKPTRMSLMRCKGCGFIAMFAKEEKKG